MMCCWIIMCHQRLPEHRKGCKSVRSKLLIWHLKTMYNINKERNILHAVIFFFNQSLLHYWGNWGNTNMTGNWNCTLHLRTHLWDRKWNGQREEQKQTHEITTVQLELVFTMLPAVVIIFMSASVQRYRLPASFTVPFRWARVREQC